MALKMRGSTLQFLAILFSGVQLGCTQFGLNLQGASSEPSTQPSPGPLPAAPTIAYSPSNPNLYANEPISPIAPAAVGGTGITFSISPNLPAGLSLNSNTGAIQGVPAAASPLTVYTITVTDSFGQSATAQLSLKTKPVFQVNSSADAADANPGDGVCASQLSACTLRAAVQEANLTTTGAKIVLPDNTYSVASGQLVISSEVDLVGASRSGTIIDGGNSHRVIDASGASLSLESLTITRGNGNDGSGVKERGAGVRYTHPSGDLSIKNVAFINNIAAHSGQGYGGGGLYFNGDEVTVTDSLFDGNQAYLSGGGSSAGGGGGAELVAKRVSVARSSFVNNRGQGFAGGLKVDSVDSASITDSTFSMNVHNDFGGLGGALHLAAQGTSNTVARNLFQSNQGDYGSAIRISSAKGGVIENNTFHSNTGMFGTSSAAINISGNDTVHFYVLRNNTFSSNSAGLYALSTRVQLANNIFRAHAQGTTSCDSLGSPNAGHSVVSLGGNIDDGTTCSMFGANDLQSTNALLAAGGPQSNGGPTNSILLEPTSPGLSFGVANQCPTVDQRGTARPVNAACTSGATQN